jgi:DNA polymerase
MLLMSGSFLHLDFETRSEVEISGANGVGLHNYVLHPSTKVLMLAWAFGQEEPQLWEPHLGPMPLCLVEGLQNPNQELAAFNSPFERYVLQYKLGIEIPASRFQDPQASARHLSLPANLEDVGYILGLPENLRKDKRGKQLLDLFSFPKRRRKKDGEGIYFNDWQTHSNEWLELGAYAKQDIVAEREIGRRLSLLKVYPLPERERQIWILDQKINDRGMPVDRVFVEKALKIAERAKQEKLEEQNKITGLENANSVAQLLSWVQERGYLLNNLRKQNIQLALKNPETKMTEECRNVLLARAEAGSTSYKKLQAILRNISPDNRLRNQFIYMGSSRCGRWSGANVQLHNLARPGELNGHSFENMDVIKEAREMIYQENYDEIKKKFGSPLLVAKNLIRTVFTAGKGKRFNVCDLNSIETRVGAWVAQCQPLLQVFSEGKDPYLDFANKITGLPYDRLVADINSKDPKIKAQAKRHRQIAKPGVLGAIYRLGGGGIGHDKNGDEIKTGLWGYAEAMGVDMTQQQAHEVVRVFRESYREIAEMWYALEEAVREVLEGKKIIRTLGPRDCIKIDKLTIKDRNPVLRIQLPSGRHLHYMDASIENTRMPWTRKNEETGEEEEVYKPCFTYRGVDQDTKKWTAVISHGGKIFENIVQAIARDILSEGMIRIENAGMEVCGHVHDEIITLTVDEPFTPGVLKMQKLMSEPMPWASDLPLGADGFENTFYRK